MTNGKKIHPSQITVNAAAQYLNVPERTVRHHLKTKKLLGHKVGKEWFIDRASVDAFAQRYGFVTGPLEPESISADDVSQGQEQPTVRFMPNGGEDAPLHSAHSSLDVSENAPETSERQRSRKVVRSLFSLRVFQLSLAAFKGGEDGDINEVEIEVSEKVRALKLDYFGFLGRGFYCFHYREKILAYREARNRLAEIAALQFLSPRTQAQGKKLEFEVLPALGALLRLTEKNHASRAQTPGFSVPMMPPHFSFQPTPWGNNGFNDPVY
jgi:excisionase family DNA binding protein